MTETSIKVLCVDDNTDLNSLIIQLINGEADMQAVGMLEDTADLAQHVATLQPDVTLLDLTIPGCNVLSNLPKLVQELRTRIVVFSAHDDSTLIEQVLHAGAAGFVCKDVATEVLVDAIRNVHSGKAVHPNNLGETAEL